MLLRDILRLPDSPFSVDILKAITIVDRIHTFSKVDPFPVVITRKRLERDAYIYRERPNRPDAIEVSALGDHRQLTFLHEVGHFLDNVALNPIKAGFASGYDPSFEPLLRWWGSNGLVVRLKATLQRHGPSDSPAARRQLRDSFTSKELWARTYAQWLTVRSADVELARQLDMVRKKGDYFAGRWCAFHWEDDEFNGIIPLVDELMEEAGLL